MAIRVNTSFLSKSAGSDHSALAELGKFGLVPIASMDFSNKNSHEASCSSDVLPSGQDQHIPRTTVPVIPQPQERELINDPNLHLLLIGNLKFPINVDYPSAPQCFLSSALRYAPKHNS